MAFRRPARARRTQRGVYRAPTLIYWDRLRRRPLGAPTVRPASGAPFMPTRLGLLARLQVQAAWGADLAADPGTWTWSDITEDVLYADRIALTHGRSDEAATSQPASCTLTLDNRSGAYSLGGQSSNWPYVRRNTPIRVRVDPDGGGFITQFQGGADAWNPDWDITGRYAVTKLSASGALRRLLQGSAPVASPFRRAMLARPNKVAYWPCEETEGAVSISSAPDNASPMRISASIEDPYPKWEECKDFPCSLPLPQVNLTTWRGTVPAYTGTGQVQFRFLARFPRAPLNGTTCVFARLYTTGTVARWDMSYTNSAGGQWSLKAFNTAGAQVLSTAFINFNLDDSTRWYSLQLSQSGANIAWEFDTIGVGRHIVGFTSGTINTQTLTAATAVVIAPDGNVDELGLGHITVESSVDVFNSGLDAFNSYAGENALTRAQRLCTENDVPLGTTGTSTARMGPQNIDTLVNLLRECETADSGLLYDGVGAGLEYVTGQQRVNSAAFLTLNAATGETTLVPVDDDQRNRNKVTAKRTAGGEATYEDTDSALGTTAIGVYDSSIKVNNYYADDVVDYAAHAVALGTLPGYRYPGLDLQLHRDPTLAPTWALILPSDRVNITNPSTVRTQHPAGTVSLLIEGFSQQIDQYLWDVHINASPYEPWRAGLWAATTADTGEFVQRVDTDGATLAAGASAGATSLSVATPSGPLWTTTADDLPLDIEVGGIKVTVTAISGGSSPQTFTVTGATVTKALPSGATVALWHPVTPGL